MWLCESTGENPFEIFQILTDIVIEILNFAHLHLIDIHEESTMSLVLINNFLIVLKPLI